MRTGQASPWLIAERARCRREGLEVAKRLFLEYPFHVAMRKLEEKANEYTLIIQKPEPTGNAGE